MSTRGKTRARLEKEIDGDSEGEVRCRRSSAKKSQSVGRKSTSTKSGR